MSVENKNDFWIQKLPNIKDLMNIWEVNGVDIDNLLSWLSENSKNTIEAKQEELAWCFEIAEFTQWLDEEKTSLVCWIFDSAFNLQTSNIA